jgi:hypothetical protein
MKNPKRRHFGYQSYKNGPYSIFFLKNKIKKGLKRRHFGPFQQYPFLPPHLVFVLQPPLEKGVPSHWWSVNLLAGGLRSAAKRAPEIEGSDTGLRGLRRERPRLSLQQANKGPCSRLFANWRSWIQASRQDEYVG